MWIFTKHGFISAVAAHGNTEVIVVRARVGKDLEKISEEHFNYAPITYDRTRDYPYRLNVSLTAFSKAMRSMAYDIDYHNFKDRVHQDGEGIRDAIYSEVWATLTGLEQLNPTEEQRAWTNE